MAASSNFLFGLFAVHVLLSIAYSPLCTMQLEKAVKTFGIPTVVVIPAVLVKRQIPIVAVKMEAPISYMRYMRPEISKTPMGTCTHISKSVM